MNLEKKEGFNLVNKLTTLLFPYSCVLCKSYSDQNLDLCTQCENLFFSTQERCVQCGIFLEGDNVYCACCTENPPYFDALYTLYIYDGPVKDLIAKMKFSKKLVYTHIFGSLFRKQLAIWYKNDFPQAVIPMPLHSARLSKRGFNQALELLRPLKEHSQNTNPYINQRLQELLILPNACKRIRNTAPQLSLPACTRKQNIKNAFQINSFFWQKKNQISIQKLEHIAIMDDVVTTGSTVNELSRMLKIAGVERIDIWCIARA